MLKKIIRSAMGTKRENPLSQFPLTPELPLPTGFSEKQIFDFVTSVRVKDAPEAEMRAYGELDFRRFVYTWGMVRNLKGECLELGGNPYFTSMLLRRFSDLNLTFANYFALDSDGIYEQAVDYKCVENGSVLSDIFPYHHFNIENDEFPFAGNSFDVVIFAEIIEHLQNDPCKVMREIHRVLKPGGTLILITPNVARLENVARLISGVNIYDPYSGYGPYGRHNREYNLHELDKLLRFEGFEPQQAFTADVHLNQSENYSDVSKFAGLLNFRKSDLGQYIFIKATKSNQRLNTKRPAWLYRSYPLDQLDL